MISELILKIKKIIKKDLQKNFKEMEEMRDIKEIKNRKTKDIWTLYIEFSSHM